MEYYVYILSNFLRTSLYVGITNDLLRRTWEHKNELVEGFTKKYHLHDLIFYESYAEPETAIAREKQLKSWSRKKKDTLIVKFNPKLVDLYDEINKT